MSTFSENLKKFRIKQGYSMDELVNRLNSNYSLKFTKTTLARWESGETSPSIEHASAISHFFEVSLDQMNNNDMLEPSKSHKQIETIAAHIDDNVTEEEMEDIKKYIEFIKSQRK